MNLCQYSTRLLRQFLDISLIIRQKKLYNCVKVTPPAFKNIHELAKYFTMIFQVSTAMYIEINGFWEVAPDSLVRTYQLHYRVKHLKMEKPAFFLSLVAIF
jgi:hypothetical protein